MTCDLQKYQTVITFMEDKKKQKQRLIEQKMVMQIHNLIKQSYLRNNCLIFKYQILFYVKFKYIISLCRMLIKHTFQYKATLKRGYMSFTFL